jgi:hypothetical protein
MAAWGVMGSLGKHDRAKRWKGSHGLSLGFAESSLEQGHVAAIKKSVGSHI